MKQLQTKTSSILETKLLVGTLLKPDDATKQAALRHSLENREVNVFNLVNLATAHRCDALLYLNLCRLDMINLLPGKVVVQLNQRYEANVIRGRAFLRESARISSALEKMGIAHSFIKGISTGMLLDPQLGAKYQADLDLLVKPRDVKEAAELIMSLGYTYGEYSLQRRKVIASQLEDLTEYISNPRRFHHLKYPLTLLDLNIPGSAIRIELHVSCGWREMDLAFPSAEDLIDTHSTYSQAPAGKWRSLTPQANLQICELQLYHDFKAFGNIALSGKDGSELFQITEISMLRKLVPSCPKDESPVTALVQEIISKLDNDDLNWQETCEGTLAEYGLKTDGLNGVFSGSLYQRLIDSSARYGAFTKTEIDQELGRRSKFWTKICANAEKSKNTVSSLEDE